MDGEIDTLERVLEVATEEHDELNASRRTASNSRAPIHRLPDEILREIFVEAGGRIVGYTCRLWRQVTLDIPWLWRDLHFTFLRDPDLPKFEMANIWIQRSRSVPLKFTIVLGDRLIASPLHLDPILHFFAPHWPRCSSLTLTYMGNRTVPSLFHYLVDEPMPILQHLDACIYGSVLSPLEIPLTLFPRLSSLSVTSGPGITISFLGSSPSLASVVLNISTLHIEALQSVISAFPNLRSLTWIGYYQRRRLDNTSVITLPPSTVELNLRGGGALDAVRRFNGPSVHSLSIHEIWYAIDVDYGTTFPTEQFPELRLFDVTSDCP